MSTIVELTEVSKRYGSDRQTPAVDGVSFAIPSGKITAIMGPSGSGKSTLLHLIGGIDRPSQGSVVVDGVQVNRLSEAALARFRRKRVGLIFQFFNLLNNLSALDNIVMPAELGGGNRKDAIGRAHELLEQLGIKGQAKKFPMQLSGGERQRVAVARAVMNRPAVLLADEPTGALDTHSGEQVMDLLADLNHAGQTIVLVTHDPRLAQRYASDVVRLVDGRIADDSTLRVANQ